MYRDMQQGRIFISSGLHTISMELFAPTGFHFARRQIRSSVFCCVTSAFLCADFPSPAFHVRNHNFMDVFIEKYLLCHKMRIWATEFYLDELKEGNQKDYMAYTDTCVHTHIDNVTYTYTHTHSALIMQSRKKQQNYYYRRSIHWKHRMIQQLILSS